MTGKNKAEKFCLLPRL